MSGKKKVVFVINSLGCGGAEKSMISLLSLFDYERYEVYLQLFRREGMFIDLLPKEVRLLPPIEFCEFCQKGMGEQLKSGNYRFLFTRARLSLALRMNMQHKQRLHDAQMYWKICRKSMAKSKETYDVAIAWGQGNPTHYVAEKIDAKNKIAFINVNYELAGHNKSFDYKFYNKFHSLVCVSDELRSLFEDVFPDMKAKMKVVYDINSRKLIEQMADSENPFSRKSEEIIIVSVGRLVKQKGYDIAVDACKRLKDRGICFKWYIVGEGPEREKLETDILKLGLQENMILAGEKKNPYTYMKNADIYVQTSRFEGYCLTLCEARMLNKPIVSTNFDVVYNQMKHEVNGLIVGMNAEAVTEGIERLLKDKSLCQKLVDNLKKEKKGNEEELEKLYELIDKGGKEIC